MHNVFMEDHYKNERSQRTPQVNRVLHPKRRYTNEQIAKRTAANGRYKTNDKCPEKIELFSRRQPDAADGKGKRSQKLDDIYESYLLKKLHFIPCNKLQAFNTQHSLPNII